jgi:class 3 adenylate cyclase
MKEAPETRYSSGGDVCVAYQVVGQGSMDVVFIPDWRHHVEAQWDDPALSHALERLASFARLVVFDKRGTGLSDPVLPSALPSLEEWMDDIDIVLGEIGSEAPVLFGQGAGGLLAMLFAAAHPERSRALILINAFARLTKAEDYPWGFSEEDQRTLLARWGRWGTGSHLDFIAPSVSLDAAIRDWFARVQRLSTSPTTSAAMQAALFGIDVRGILGTITVPTLVMATEGNSYVAADHGRYIADHISGAKFVALEGADHYWWYENGDRVVDEVQEFLTGARAGPLPDRVLATVVFSDLVASTERMRYLGDRRWTELLDRHDALCRRQVQRFRGRVVKSTGDGMVAVFDGPGRAIHAACAIRDALRGLDLQVRIGVHAGEIETRGEDVAGLAVHIAQRVQAVAHPDEVLVSRTVADLVAGSAIGFVDRGDHELKGVSGTWKLYAVVA